MMPSAFSSDRSWRVFFSSTPKQVRKTLPARTAFTIKHDRSGFTIIELLVVILLIAIIARVALPTVASIGTGKNEVAAASIAAALRFARDQAIHNAVEHGVRINRVTGQVTVFRPNLTTTPVSIDTVLYNPFTKLPYDFNIAEGELTAGVSIGNTVDPFKYRNNAARQSDILFDVQGMPIFISGTDRYHLENGSIIVRAGSESSDVVVAPFTGRVAIQ